MIAQQPFRLSHEGATINGVLHVSDRPSRRPTVVICHGFKGFMDWGFFPPLAELLARRGFSVVRFNYSGIGQRPGDDRVTDLDAFRRNTHSRERDETLAVLRALGTEIGTDVIDDHRLALVGHSRGGGAAVLAAADPSMQTRLRALVTWASVATFDRYDAATKAQWQAAGMWTITNGRTGQTLPLGIELLDDIEHNAEGSLDLLAAAQRCTAPWLIVHGTDDETVRVDDAQRLGAHAGGKHALHLIEGANHTFGAKHPFAGPTPHVVETFNATQRWLRRHLSERPV